MKNYSILTMVLGIALIMSCEKPNTDASESEGETSRLKGVTLTLEKINTTTAYFTGVVSQMSPDLIVGIHWDYDPIEHISNTTLVKTDNFYEGGKFLIQINNLPSNETIYYMPYVYRNGVAEYGDCLSFKTPGVTMTVEKVEVNGFEAVFKGIADLDGEGGILVSTNSQLSIKNYMSKLMPVPNEVDKTYEYKLIELSRNTTYYFCSYYYDKKQGNYVYGDVKSFSIGAPVITIDDVAISSNEVTFKGNVALDCVGGIFYTKDSSFSDIESCANIDLSYVSEIPYERKLILTPHTKYFYCTYYVDESEYQLGEIGSFTTGADPSIKDLSLSSATDLSKNGTANCYIVSEAGLYKIKTVKGNDRSQTLTSAASPALLWETFGTNVMPSRMDLISGVCYKDGYLIFQTANTFKEGNALIAVKDKNDNIIWSWHIWFTDQPQGQVYYNNAGTMMDRNLGATSATPGDVGALGLLYQWGRKDPFLGSSSISSSTIAKSTITWPSTVKSDSSTGTIEYATAHPTTFITSNSSNFDWYYTFDNTRWTTSETTKSIYDPCPVGWRVPDGGEDGVWSEALGSSSSFYHTYSSGMNFSGKFGSDQTIWYPASGFRKGDGSLNYVGYEGNYWSASPSGNNRYYSCLLGFDSSGVGLSGQYNHSCGFSVRCIKE